MAEAKFNQNLEAMENASKQEALLRGGGLGKREQTGRGDIERGVLRRNLHVDRIAEDRQRRQDLQSAKIGSLGRETLFDQQEQQA